ncbi:MAG: hypothetical protein J6D16_06605, partial [Clostridia bacterium]|nr:hypothetical protein [Clostridia bacterium]
GKVLLVKSLYGNLAHETERRGHVFYVGNSFDGEGNTGNNVRKGLVYGAMWAQRSVPMSGSLVEIYPGSKMKGTWGTATAGSGVFVTTDGETYVEAAKLATAINGTYADVLYVDVFKDILPTGTYAFKGESSAANDGKPCKVASNATWTLDFHGNLFQRGNNYSRIEFDGTGVNATIKNARFDDSNLASGLYTMLVASGGATLTVENCSFTNMSTTGTPVNLTNGAAITVVSSTLYLKDVEMTNCTGVQGAVGCYGNNCKIYVAGNTRIFNDEDDTKNYVHLYTGNSSIGVWGDFTGQVQVSIGGVNINKPVIHSGTASTDEYKSEACAVAEGAEIRGLIYLGNDKGYLAYNNDGVLCWTRPGTALPTDNLKPVTVDASDKTKLTCTAWFYNDGTTEAQTTAAISGVCNYYIKETTVEADAYIVKDDGSITYGALATVLSTATAGQTVEVMRDIEGLANLSIPAACTVDGNGKTLTVYVGAESPTLDANNHWYLIKTLASGVTLKNLNISGGAAQKGVWAGALSPQNLLLINVTASQTLTMDNCTVTGLRMQVDDTIGANGLIIKHNSAGVLNLKDCEFTDNMVMIPQDSTTSKVYNSAKIWFRVYSSGNMNLEGKIVIKDNWSITSDGVTAISDNLTDVVAARLHVGQLTEGSHIEMRYSAEYTPIPNEQGKLYDNTGYFYYYTPANLRTIASYPNGLTGSASKTGGVLHYNGATVLLITKDSIGITAPARQASVDSDKVDFRYTLTVKADYFGTEVVTKIHGEEVARTPLYNFTPSASVITVPVAVGMAELDDEIVIELQDASGAVLASTTSDTVKAYALSILEGEYPDTMKAAIASLLQYGATVQTHFGHNTENLAMTAGDLESWTALGVTVKTVDSNTLNTASATVAATASGTLPESVKIQGATLTMENETSLRLYVTVTGDATFTVNNKEASLKTDTAGRTYLEASNIGTASLATAATFTISDGTDTYTYNASPMSYVYTVQTATHGSITASLKAACEALYYYYEAIAAHFDLTNNTGFTTSDTVVLETISDTPNTFSAPYTE